MSHRPDLPAEIKARAVVATEWGFERATVDALLAAATVREFPRGAAIYPQGTHRNSIFLLLAGEVSVSVLLRNGQRVLCAFYRPGTLFGFPLVEGERPRWSAADAFTPATVAMVPRREFEHVLTGLPPALLIRFFNKVLERQARFAMRLVHCAALDLRGRLALTLLDLAKAFGVAEADGMRVRLPLTHDHLAEMVGASRERISKSMASLQDEHLIRYSRQAITVLDVNGLRELATPQQ